MPLGLVDCPALWAGKTTVVCCVALFITRVCAPNWALASARTLLNWSCPESPSAHSDSGRSRMCRLSNPELRFRAALHLARPTMPARSTKEPEVSALAELEELLEMLLESARRLPAGPDRHSILGEILNFNLRLAKLEQRHTPRPAP